MKPFLRRAGYGLLFSLALLTPRTAPADPASPPAVLSAAPATDYPGAVWAPASPGNFQPSARPLPGLPIDRIVIHDIEGAGPEAIRWFQNPQAQVSSHYVVDGQTGRITQLVRERDIAWHAGDHLTNARSIGIEHGGYAYRPGFYNPVEYEASAHLVRAIALRYAIPRDRTHIIGHFEVPDTAHPGHFGGRNGHTDPGPCWDWDYFMALVRSDAQLGPAPAPSAFLLHPGETVPAAFTLINTGDDPWPADPTASSNAVLRSQGPVYLGRWTSDVPEASSAFSGPDWVSPRFAASPVGGDTAPGASGRFVVPLHASPAFLGAITETFRLVKVPPAPHLPVPFGPTLTVSARVVPWDIRAALPPAPPGWAAKTLPDGTRALWCKAAVRGPRQPAPVRWQAVLPITGAWDVSVRWPAGTGRTASAAYQVRDTAGAKTILTDQRRGGGQWHTLGRFRFGSPPEAPNVRPGAPLPTPAPILGTIALLPIASAPGVLVAGEVRFVGPYPAAH